MVYDRRMKRLQLNQILKDLQKKIVFIVGPRQVGKTWLALEAGKHFSKTTYLNYDHFEDQEIIKTETWPRTTELLILDELHKMPGWKNYLKGLYDTKKEHLKILVTGSARLDAFRQTGDSLAGRFFAQRLMPFTLAELKKQNTKMPLERFLERGGFPEPFLADDPVDAKRWRNQYIDGLIRTDILGFDLIHDLAAIKTLYELLRRSVGSTVSFASLGRDAGISPVTSARYINILESLFIVFRITPFTRNIGRSLLKSPKIYFFDTPLIVGNEGAIFENHVAISLLKHVYALNDLMGENYELRYLRTKDGREVDFCICRDENIEYVVEAKCGDTKVSAGLSYFCEHYDLKGKQLVKNIRRPRSVGKIDIDSAEEWLAGLFL
jgi:predicted AAA+ superfamily ATPase